MNSNRCLLLLRLYIFRIWSFLVSDLKLPWRGRSTAFALLLLLVSALQLISKTSSRAVVSSRRSPLPFSMGLMCLLTLKVYALMPAPAPRV